MCCGQGRPGASEAQEPVGPWGSAGGTNKPHLSDKLTTTAAPKFSFIAAHHSADLGSCVSAISTGSAKDAQSIWERAGKGMAQTMFLRATALLPGRQPMPVNLSPVPRDHMAPDLNSLESAEHCVDLKYSPDPAVFTAGVKKTANAALWPDFHRATVRLGTGS